MNGSLLHPLLAAVLFVGTGAAVAQVQPAPSASQPGVAARSSAADKAQGAQTPGELRPEQPVVPQVSVPLRRASGVMDNADQPRAPAAGGVDDRAARCGAIVAKAERAACERAVKPAPAAVRTAPRAASAPRRQ